MTLSFQSMNIFQVPHPSFLLQSKPFFVTPRQTFSLSLSHTSRQTHQRRQMTDSMFSLRNAAWNLFEAKKVHRNKCCFAKLSPKSQEPHVLEFYFGSSVYDCPLFCNDIVLNRSTDTKEKRSKSRFLPSSLKQHFIPLWLSQHFLQLQQLPVVPFVRLDQIHASDFDASTEKKTSTNVNQMEPKQKT